MKLEAEDGWTQEILNLSTARFMCMKPVGQHNEGSNNMEEFIYLFIFVV